MKDISSKTDNTSSLPAAAFNSMVSEMENAVTDAGFSLDNGSETTADPNPTQISAAIGAAGRDADAFTDSGSANTYTLTKIRGKAETAYRNGAKFRFVPANTNSGASTINIQVIGSKDIRFGDNSALTAGAIRVNTVCEVIYDSAADNFKLKTPVIISSMLPAASATEKGAVSYEQSGSFTVYLRSGSSSSGTAYFTRVGKLVTVSLPDIFLTTVNSNFTLSESSGSDSWPSNLRPTSANAVCVVRVRDSTDSFGLAVIQTGGTVNLFKDAGAVSFSGSNVQKGVRGTTISYTVE